VDLSCVFLLSPSPGTAKNRFSDIKSNPALHQRFMQKVSPKDMSFSPRGKQREREVFRAFFPYHRERRENRDPAKRWWAAGFEATKKPVG